MLARRGGIIAEGDVIIVFHGHDDYRPLKVTSRRELHCKEGRFKHDDMIGARFGSRIKGLSNNKIDTAVPTLLLLQNSPDLWTLAVPHRTQIIYNTDIAAIIFGLRVKTGSVVLEAGTGSGSLTHSFARAVAPTGKVFTFDFHLGRAQEARREFQENGVAAAGDNVGVVSGWRDVCTPGKNDPEGEPLVDVESIVQLEQHPPAGFGLPALCADAVFLDVPSPWTAIDNVQHVLKPNGMLCTFSPCIEQTQRTCDALRKDPSEFVDIRTVEVLTKFFDPVFKRRRLETSDSAQDSRNSSESSTVIHFTPQQTSKGHSAYLTFSRRRLSRIDDKVALSTTPEPPKCE
jgi:tRNA (adenine57-N1/adenine58-N1)-methyltransferase